MKPKLLIVILILALFSCKQEKNAKQDEQIENENIEIEHSLEVKCDNPEITKILSEIYINNILPKKNKEIYDKIYGKVDYNKYSARLYQINIIVNLHSNVESLKDYADVVRDKELHNIVAKRIELKTHIQNYINGERNAIPSDILVGLDEIINSGNFFNIRPNIIDKELKKCDCSADYENVYFGRTNNINYTAQLNSENQFYVEAFIE